jgi:hypothetical protein
VRLCNKSKRYFPRELFSESKIDEGGPEQKNDLNIGKFHYISDIVHIDSC